MPTHLNAQSAKLDILGKPMRNFHGNSVENEDLCEALDDHLGSVLISQELNSSTVNLISRMHQEENCMPNYMNICVETLEKALVPKLIKNQMRMAMIF